MAIGDSCIVSMIQSYTEGRQNRLRTLAASNRAQVARVLREVIQGQHNALFRVPEEKMGLLQRYLTELEAKT